jgi:hypothetical protein
MRLWRQQKTYQNHDISRPIDVLNLFFGALNTPIALSVNACPRRMKYVKVGFLLLSLLWKNPSQWCVEEKVRPRRQQVRERRNPSADWDSNRHEKVKRSVVK